MSKTQDATATANQNAAASMMGLGDLSVIRNILFGQQAAEFDHKFETTIARLDRTDAANQKHFEQLEKDLRAAIAELSSLTDARIKSLDAKVDQTAALLAESIRKTSLDDRAALGSMLIEIGQKLGGKPA